MNTFKKKTLVALVLCVLCVCLCAIGVSAAEVTDTGSLGDSLTWTLYDNGELVIEGTGEMPDYSPFQQAPWATYNRSALSLTVEEGVTSVGAYAFQFFNQMTAVSLPEGLTSIGEGAFTHCAFSELTVPSTVMSISEYAIGYCTSLERVTVLSGSALFNGPAIFQGVSPDFTLYGYEGSTAQLYAERNALPFEALDGPAVDLTDVAVETGDLSEDLHWTMYANGVLAIYGSGVMPDYLNSNQIPWAQYKNAIAGVTIGEGITYIGRSNFDGCALTTVSIADSVTEIGYMAFFNSNLTEVTISANVAHIGENAFARCPKLSEITVAADNLNYTSDKYGALFNKAQTVLLQYPAGAPYTDYIIPDTVEVIGSRAFSDAETLNHIHIGANVNAFNLMAFFNCTGLMEFTVDENNAYFSTQEGILFSQDGSVLYQYTTGHEASAYTIPDGVTVIGEYAFSNSNVNAVTLSADITTIGWMAFSSCRNLTEITIPASIDTIEYGAFNGCRNMTSATVLNPNAEIGNIAFSTGGRNFVLYGYAGSTAEAYAANNNLTFVALEAPEVTVVDTGSCGDDLTWTLFSDGEIVISGTGAMDDWYVVADIPWKAYEDDITKVTIESGVTTVGAHAFNGASSVQSVSLADTVTEIRAYSFKDCDSLESIYIPASVNSIEIYAFAYCDNMKAFEVDPESTRFTVVDGVLFTKSESKLIQYPAGSDNTEYTIPLNTKSIGWGAFTECRNLKNLIVSDNVTSIGRSAICGCPNLETIFFGAGVNLLDTDPILSNEKLTAINVDSSNTFFSSENGVLFNKKKTDLILYPAGRTDTSYIVPNTVKNIALNAFCQSSLASITLPEGLLTVGNSAFSNCENLTDIEIPSTVTLIDGFAFSNSVFLTSVTVLSPDAEYGNRVFHGCRRITLYSYEGSTTEAYASENDLPFTVIEKPVPTVVDTGSCGENLIWTLYSDGQLVIEGTGPMNDYFQMEAAPWDAYWKTISSVTVKEGVTTIGDYAFVSVKATAITLPEGITSIGMRAFAYCEDLTELTIPATVTVIDDYAFQSCTSITKLTVLSPYALFNGANLFYLVENPPVLYGYAGSTAEAYASANGFDFVRLDGPAADLDSKTVANGECGDSITWTLFASGKLILSGTGDMWDYGGEHLMWYQYRPSIKEIVVEEGITYIGVNAFFNTAVTTATLPSSVRAMGNNAFAGCTALTSVTIGKNLTELGGQVFFRCFALEEIVVDKENSYYASDEHGALFTKDMTTLIQYPAGKALAEYTVPETVTTIAARAFEGAKMGILHLPASLTTVFGTMTFHNMTSLTAITVDEANEVFSADENGVLYSKDGKTLLLYPIGKAEDSYTVSESVTAIAEYAFWGSTLQYVTLPEGLESIGKLAFGSNFGLREITIPKSVGIIGDSAFNACQFMTKATILGSDTEFGEGVFSHIWGDFTIYGYAGSTAEAYAAQNYHAFEKMELLGDINLDGAVDIKDALNLFQYSMNHDTYPIYYTGNVDFTKDGNIDIKDALRLFQYSMNPDTYPIA